MRICIFDIDGHGHEPVTVPGAHASRLMLLRSSNVPPADDLRVASQVFVKAWSSGTAVDDSKAKADDVWSSFARDVWEIRRATQRLLSFPGMDIL